MAIRRRRVAILLVGAAIAAIVAAGIATPTAAQNPEPHTGQPAVVKQIAPDLYFFYDFDSSNSVFLVTDAGVLVIDTREHPRAAQDLIARIRKVTDKPIKWVINSHFHGDHTYGNATFQAAGATFVAQQETARIMKLVQPKEMARRQDYFKENNFDPNEVKLILADVTFDNQMSIYLGGREIRLMYFGPGQQPGDTFVLFPHDRVLFTLGALAHQLRGHLHRRTSLHLHNYLGDVRVRRIGNHEHLHQHLAHVRIECGLEPVAVLAVDRLFADNIDLYGRFVFAVGLDFILRARTNDGIEHAARQGADACS